MLTEAMPATHASVRDSGCDRCWRRVHRAGGAAGAVLAMVAMIATEAAAVTVCRTAETAQRGALRFQTTDVLPRVQLERLGARELLGGVRAERTVRTKSELMQPQRPLRRHVRRIPSLWQRQLPVGVALGDIRVQHRVVYRGLAADAAQSVDDANAKLPVVLRPTYPVEVCRRDGYRIVEGGVVVELVTRGLPAAGQYRFQIETNVGVP